MVKTEDYVGLMAYFGIMGGLCLLIAIILFFILPVVGGFLLAASGFWFLILFLIIYLYRRSKVRKSENKQNEIPVHSRSDKEVKVEWGGVFAKICYAFGGIIAWFIVIGLLILIFVPIVIAIFANVDNGLIGVILLFLTIGTAFLIGRKMLEKVGDWINEKNRDINTYSYVSNDSSTEAEVHSISYERAHGNFRR